MLLYRYKKLGANDLDNKKKKRFKLFDITRDGKGISKNRKELGPGLQRFFISFKDNFGKLVSVNIFYVLGNFPVFALIAAFTGVSKNSVFLPISDLFQNINGLIIPQGSITPYNLTLYAIEGLQGNAYASTPLTYVLYAIGALALFTFGIVNVGTAYILRNMVKGEPLFIWTDFWYSVKRNWKQALPFGIIDFGINFLLIFNIYTLITTTSHFFASMMFWSNIVIFVVYFFMRYYIYIQMVTFKLSVFKILKNSLIFALLGFKRNILALLGIIVTLLLDVMIMFGFGGIFVPIAVAAPLALLFAAFAYMKVYAAYFKVKEVMIDPYLEEHPELANKNNDEEEIIMHDDVTQKEKLEEIKRRNNIE